MNIRDQILSHAPAVEPVEAFGTTVYVREMRAGEVNSFQRYLTDHKDGTGLDVSRELLLRTLCDEQGERLFTDEEGDVLDALAIQDVRQAYTAAERLNTITDDDVQDAEENSDATVS